MAEKGNCPKQKIGVLARNGVQWVLKQVPGPVIKTGTRSDP